jgi:hypothetical protein
MRLALHELLTIHPKLRGHPTDLCKFGSLALQRAGHTSPVPAEVVHDDVKSTAEIEWRAENPALLDVLDKNRVTEDGAEAVALTYVHSKAGWVVKRRMNRGESADWLLTKETRSLALEVSGTMEQDPVSRLWAKRQQVSHCTLADDYPIDRLAVVVAFSGPMILAGRP